LTVHISIEAIELIAVLNKGNLFVSQLIHAESSLDRAMIVLCILYFDWEAAKALFENQRMDSLPFGLFLTLKGAR